MRGNQSYRFGPISGDTPQFELMGGAYTIDVVTSSGDLMLERLGPDDTTFIDALAADIAETGSITVALPPGQYVLTNSTADTYVVIARVPGE